MSRSLTDFRGHDNSQALNNSMEKDIRQIVMEFSDVQEAYDSKCLLWEAPGIQTERLASILASRIVTDFSSKYLNKVNSYLSQQCQLPLFTYGDTRAAIEASDKVAKLCDPVLEYCRESAITELDRVRRYIRVDSVCKLGQLSNIASVLLEMADEVSDDDLASWLIDMPKHLQQQLLDCGLLEPITGEFFVTWVHSRGTVAGIQPSAWEGPSYAITGRIYLTEEWSEGITPLDGTGVLGTLPWAVS